MKIKQHELLAIETDVNNLAHKMLNETEALFDRSTAFDEHSKLYKAFEEGDKDIPDAERKKMITTVKERLAYTMSPLAKAIDVMVSKETTNTVAKADIIIKDEDGNVVATLGKDIPVSALLQLEKRFVETRKMYDKMPTFNTETHWIKGVNLDGVDCWQVADAGKTVRTRTEKITEAFNPNPVSGGDKFKLEPIEKQVVKPVGEYTTMVKTGRISPAEKSQIIGRLDKVIAAIKAARAVANSIDTVENNIGRDIFKFING